jgi:hypothetical protein
MNGFGTASIKSQFTSFPLCNYLYIFSSRLFLQAQQFKTDVARERRGIREANHLESTYTKEHAQKESKNEVIRTTAMVSMQVVLNS